MLAGITVLAAGLAIAPEPGKAAGEDLTLDDPLFRRCVDWMIKGYGGALIDNRCIDDFGIPPPSLFLCARKVHAGFDSTGDRATCAALFDEQARKTRAGYVK